MTATAEAPPETLPLKRPYKGPRWEYHTIRVETLRGDYAKLNAAKNEMGAEGWEAYAADFTGTGCVVFFKRPARTDAPGKMPA